MLLGGRADTEELRQRFLREIRVQASLNHPNIATVHNALWMDDDLIMVMELVEGDSLQCLLARGPVPLRAGIDYIRQVLSALSYAHAHGVIHRDITPANIMITPDGTVKLTDFGLAKSPNDQSFTKSGVPLGSPHYMSPEQVKGIEANARTDIYSVGAVLYEIATGKRAFAADSAFATMQAHVDGAPPPPITLAPAIPPALNDIILTALQTDPSARFQTADEFRARLQAVMLAPAVPAFRNSGTYLHIGAGAAAVGILLVAGVVGTQKQTPLANPPVPPPPSAPAIVQPVVEIGSSIPEPEPPVQAHAVKTRPVARPRSTLVARAQSSPVATAASTPKPPEAEPPPKATTPQPPQTPAPGAEPPRSAGAEIRSAAEPAANYPGERPEKSSRLRRLFGRIRHPFK